MTTDTKPTITRVQLQEICERTIQAVPSLTHEDKTALRRVARTARRVAGDGIWWDTKTECGCLVGTLLKGVPVTHTALYCVGVIYLRALRQVVGYDGTRGHVLQVIDP